MSNLKKTIFIFSIALFAFCLLFYFAGFWVISTEWKREFSTEQISEWTENIENTPKIPENFNSVYTRLNPESRKNEIKAKYHDYVWKHLFGYWPKRSLGSDFYSQKVSQLIQEKDNRTWKNFFDKSLVLAFGIESYITPSKCVDYYLNNLIVNIPLKSSDTLLQIKGIEGMAKFKFNKGISKLDEEEVLNIIITFEISNKHIDRFNDSAYYESRKKILRGIMENRGKKE